MEVLRNNGCKGHDDEVAGIPLYYFSPWAEIPLKGSLAVPSSSELEEEVGEVNSFPHFSTW